MNFNTEQFKSDVAPLIGAIKYHWEKRKGVYAVALLVTLVSTALFSHYTSPEYKRSSQYDEAKAIESRATSDLSRYVSKAIAQKELLSWAEDCAKKNEKEYFDCDALKSASYEVKFIAVGTGTTIKQKEPDTVIPVVSAAELPNPATWLTNSQGQSKSRAELGGNNFEGISASHKIPLEYWYDAERKYKVKKEVALCIAWADSGLGKYLKSTNNIGNVGNNDRGDTVHYDSLKDGVEAVFKVLNNKYLKNKYSIGSLSPGGGGSKPYYATSKENWDVNVRNCLSVVHGQAITKDFTIRLK